MLNRLNGPPFALNPDLIQRAEGTPDTVLTLVDGTHYIVAEPVAEVVSRIRDFRASVIALAHALETGASVESYDVDGSPARSTAAAGATVVRLHRREP